VSDSHFFSAAFCPHGDHSSCFFSAPLSPLITHTTHTPTFFRFQRIPVFHCARCLWPLQPIVLHCHCQSSVSSHSLCISSPLRLSPSPSPLLSRSYAESSRVSHPHSSIENRCVSKGNPLLYCCR
jgi:hypothetical protein